MLLLTERTEHLDAIEEALTDLVPSPLLLHGRMSKKQRAGLLAELNALASDAPCVLLATGKLVGEGINHPALDTLVLAMPISWKGTFPMIQILAGMPAGLKNLGHPPGCNSRFCFRVARSCRSHLAGSRMLGPPIGFDAAVHL